MTKNPLSLTPGYSAVLKNAADTAHGMKHKFVAPEHLLLGLVQQKDGVGATVLLNADITEDRLRAVVGSVPQKRLDPVGPKKTKEFPKSPDTLRILAQAEKEAEAIGHDYVGTEHILLALLADEDGSAYKLLVVLGVRPAQLRDTTLVLLGVGQPSADQQFETWAKTAHEDLKKGAEHIFSTIRASLTPDANTIKKAGHWAKVGEEYVSGSVKVLSSLVKSFRVKDETFQILHGTIQAPKKKGGDEILVLMVRDKDNDVILKEIPTHFLPNDPPLSTYNWSKTDLVIRVYSKDDLRVPTLVARKAKK